MISCMLFVYTGADYQRSNKLANQLIVGLQAKQPEAELVLINSQEGLDLETKLLSLASDQGLFFQKTIVSIGRLLPDKDLEATVKKLIPTLQQSPSIFIWREPKLDKNWLKRLEKNKVTIEVSGDNSKASKPKTVFDAAKALVNGDNKKLWQLIKELQQSGIDAENIYGTLWWQVKTLYLAKIYSSAKAAGIAPYSYTSASRSRYSIVGINQLIEQLTRAQLQSKTSGSLGLGVELESFALGFRVE